MHSMTANYLVRLFDSYSLLLLNRSTDLAPIIYAYFLRAQLQMVVMMMMMMMSQQITVSVKPTNPANKFLFVFFSFAINAYFLPTKRTTKLACRMRFFAFFAPTKKNASSATHLKAPITCFDTFSSITFFSFRFVFFLFYIWKTKHVSNSYNISIK